MDALEVHASTPSILEVETDLCGFESSLVQISQGYVRAYMYYSVSQNKTTHKEEMGY